MEEVKGDNDSRKRAQQELEKLKVNIAAREAELEELKPEVSYIIIEILNNKYFQLIIILINILLV